MRFLTGLLVLGMSLWTTQAYEIGLVRDGLTTTTERWHYSCANFVFL